MTYGYSTDLRKKALVLYESGKTQIEVCAAYNIARKTLCNWLKLHRDTGDVSLRPRPAERSTRKLTPQALKAYFEEHPDHFLREAKDHFNVHPSAIAQACRKFGITRKKNVPLQRAVHEKKTRVSEGNTEEKS